MLKFPHQQKISFQPTQPCLQGRTERNITLWNLNQRAIQYI